MYITKIQLEQFRNMEEIVLYPCPGINVIYGNNAQGKTNLAEAIWMFTGAKSFRGAKEKEMLRFGSEQTKLHLEFWGENRHQTADLHIKNQKIAFLNEIQLESAAKLAGHFYAVVFSPSHLSLVKDGPALRRKFLDTALCQIIPKYEANLKEYHRILDQRNALLKDLEHFPQLSDTVDIWDQHLAKCGAWLLYCRAQYVKRILPVACEVYSGISNAKEQLSLSLESSIGAEEDMDREQLQKRFYDSLQKNRSTDIQKRATSCGPHRDDLELKVNDLPLRLYGSQGQQRSCVLALKLAECAVIEELTGESPVILLDDVMSELDSQRRSYLLNRIKGRQVFVTCCDQESVQLLEEGKAFHIDSGHILGENQPEREEK